MSIILELIKELTIIFHFKIIMEIGVLMHLREPIKRLKKWNSILRCQNIKTNKSLIKAKKLIPLAIMAREKSVSQN